MKYCTECGKRLENDARFCSGCGRPCEKVRKGKQPVPAMPGGRVHRSTFSDKVLPFLAGTAIGSVLVRMLGGNPHAETHAAEGQSQGYVHETVIPNEDHEYDLRADEYEAKQDAYGAVESFDEAEEWEDEDDWDSDGDDEYGDSYDEPLESDYDFYNSQDDYSDYDDYDDYAGDE